MTNHSNGGTSTGPHAGHRPNKAPSTAPRRVPARPKPGGQAARGDAAAADAARDARQPGGASDGGSQAGKGRRRRRPGNRNRRPQRSQQRNQQGQHGKQSGQRGGHSGHGGRNAGGSQRATSTSRMVTRDETSAGGLVVSGLAEAVSPGGAVDLSQIYVALIGRLDRRGRLLWSMPKGHVENNEAKNLTAEREVWEETGIVGEVFADLGVIDYWFVSDGVRIHKTVHHHLLRFVDGILNDEDPEVTEVAWIPVSELIEHLAYADERKLARIAHDLLPELARKEAAAGKATPR